MTLIEHLGHLQEPSQQKSPSLFKAPGEEIAAKESTPKVPGEAYKPDKWGNLIWLDECDIFFNYKSRVS